MSTRPSPLSETELNRELKNLKSWTIKDGKLFRIFGFQDFAEAMSFMVRAISFIEKSNHHPEWLNVYNRVEVSLVTHEAKGTTLPAITTLDIDLAKHLDSFA